MRQEAPWTINDLDKKVEIALSNNSTDAGTGIVTKGWLAAVEVYANIIEMPASKEKEISGGILYDRVIDVVIRYESTYKSTYNRLKYDGLYYDIIECREIYGRFRWLRMKCVYGGKELNR